MSNKANVHDIPGFQNPIPTSPGLASFGVTSNSGVEVSSFRNLNKRNNLVNGTIQTKLLRKRGFKTTLQNYYITAKPLVRSMASN